jgi:hypothetical protein
MLRLVSVVSARIGGCGVRFTVSALARPCPKISRAWAVNSARQHTSEGCGRMCLLSPANARLVTQLSARQSATHSFSKSLAPGLLAVHSPNIARGAGACCRGLVTLVSPDGRLRVGRPKRLRRRLALWWTRSLGRGRKGGLLTERQAHIIANASFILVFASFVSTDMFELRALSVAAGGLMFVFNALAMERPLWISRSEHTPLLGIQIYACHWRADQAPTG